MTFRGPESPEALAARLDMEADRIDGLVTFDVVEDELRCLVASPRDVPRVREAVRELGVPDDVLSVQVVWEALIPYPVEDERLRRWIEKMERIADAEADVEPEANRLSLAPRRILTVLAIAVVAWLVLSIMAFLVLGIVEGLGG